MKITYLAHSGFLVELDTLYLLFDYYTGPIPPLVPEKELHVFASHAHHDHYNDKIWSLRARHPRLFYVLSDDITLSAAEKKRLGLVETGADRNSKHPQPDGEGVTMAGADAAFIFPVTADASYRISENVTVETLLSTDEGVVFIVRVGDLSIFHAGDLNLWTWPGDDEAVNEDRLRRFMLEMEKIKGMCFDVAFFPLDPRQEADCGRGLGIFQETVKARRIFPMHFWGKYEIIGQYVEKWPENSGNVMMIEREGQVFEVRRHP